MIIASYSRYLLRRFLRRHAGRGGYFFSPQAMPGGLADELRTLGLQPLELPDFSDVEREQALRQYVELVGRLGRANADHPLWWATELAAKNRFTSPLAELLTPFARCQRAAAIAAQDDGLLVLWKPPWPWWAAHQAGKSSAPAAGRLLAWPGSRLLARWRGKGRAWVRLLRGVAGAWGTIAVTWWLGGRKLIPDTGDTPVFLIRSFVYPGSVSSGRFIDPFFGRLHQLAYAADNTALPLTVVQGTGNRVQVYRRLLGLAGEPVAPVEAYLGVLDTVREATSAIGSLTFKRFAVPDDLEWLGTGFSAAIRDLLGSGGWSLQFLQLLHARAAQAILRKHRVQACALTYEGNAWERMFIKGLRSDAKPPAILGFQHSVVPPAAAGVFVSEAEVQVLPLPDRILTTGRIPTGMLQRYGALPAAQYVTTGALRYEYLGRLETEPWHHGENRVLVALEGVGPVVSMLAYALDQASLYPDIRFCIRAHPVLSLEMLLQQLGRDARQLPPNIEISIGRPVRDDVTRANVILYWGSTVAIEAVFMGRPVIHFSAGELLSYDPLCELSGFKWTTCPDTRLGDILSTIQGLDDKEYTERQSLARAHVAAYFEPVDDAGVRETLRQALTDGNHRDDE